jgi:hypothetical protein
MRVLSPAALRLKEQKIGESGLKRRLDLLIFLRIHQRFIETKAGFLGAIGWELEQPPIKIEFISHLSKRVFLPAVLG